MEVGVMFFEAEERSACQRSNRFKARGPWLFVDHQSGT